MVIELEANLIKIYDSEVLNAWHPMPHVAHKLDKDHEN